MAFNDERYKVARARQVPEFIRDLATLRDCVEDVRVLAGDDEVAHSREDEVRHAVLSAIAAGVCTDEARALAALALTTTNIEFARWCA